MSGFWTTQQVSEAVDGVCTSVPRPLSGVFHDSRDGLADGLYIALRGPVHDGHSFCAAAVQAGAVAVLVDHQCELPEQVAQIIVPDTLAALSTLAGRWRTLALADVKIIAVTGTAGKTTTKDLLHAIGKEAGAVHASPRSFNNAIGVPLTLLGTKPEDALLIAEVGINAPGELQPLANLLQPDVCVITLIGHGHLEGLGDIDTVRREKYLLAEAAHACVFVFDQGGPLPEAQVPVRTYGDLPSSDHVVGFDAHTVQVDGTVFRAVLPGRAGAMNIAAAVCAARAVGIDDGCIERGLRSARISGGRGQVEQLGSMTLIDDTWNSNPQSLEAALEAAASLAQGRPLALVLGSMLELGSHCVEAHERMGEQVRALSVDTAVFIGEETRSALAAVPNAVFLPEASADALAEAARCVGGPNRVVLVKGSRSLRLERLVDLLRRESQVMSSQQTMRTPEH
jgi:UDP-N-acetylmuramoyl-tripeptide--D-alanyl-D-alanine ligase